MFSKKISFFVLPFMAMVSLEANDPFFNDPFGDDIFKEMYQMQKEMDKVFERMQERMEQRTQLWNYPTKQGLLQHNGMARTNLIEDKGTYYEYNTQIPENKNNQIDVNIEDGILRLKATVDTVQKTEQSNMKMQQHSMRMLQRSETLPNDANVSSLKGEYKQGMFVLTLQKKKTLLHQAVKEKESEQTSKIEKMKKKETSETPTIEKVKDKNENNTTWIKVPHTSSHV